MPGKTPYACFDGLEGLPPDFLDQFKHFIFDCDGLLLDTEPLYTRSALRLLSQLLNNNANTPHLPPSLKLSIMGQNRLIVGEKISNWAHHTHHAPLLSPQEWSSAVLPFEEDEFKKGFPILEGVPELLRHASSAGINLALATSSSRHTFQIKASQHPNLFSHFPIIICGDDREMSSTDGLPLSKPHPRIFQLARQQLPADSSPALAFEDSPNGVIAALRAGCSVIWVPGEEIASVAQFDCLEAVDDGSHPLPPNLFVLKVSSLTQIYRLLNKSI